MDGIDRLNAPEPKIKAAAGIQAMNLARAFLFQPFGHLKICDDHRLGMFGNHDCIGHVVIVPV